MKSRNPFHIWALAAIILSLVLGACSPTAAKKFPTGKFSLSSDQNKEYEFKEDLSWAYYEGGLMAAKGTYRVEGNSWIEQGTDECPFEGKYTWSYDGKNLTFKLDGSDSCAPRRAATDGQTFVLKP